MKSESFWSRYKRGVLLSVLPIVLLFVLCQLGAFVSGLSDWLIPWVPNSKVLRIIFALAAILFIPFLLGCVASTASFGKAADWLVAKLPAKIHWPFKVFFRGRASDRKKDSSSVAVFRVYSGEKEETFKIGSVVQTFDRIGSHDFGKDYCLILEMTAGVPLGPFWIKKKEDIIFVGPEFDLKDLMVTALSLGLNFPNEEKPTA